MTTLSPIVTPRQNRGVGADKDIVAYFNPAEFGVAERFFKACVVCENVDARSERDPVADRNQPAMTGVDYTFAHHMKPIAALKAVVL